MGALALVLALSIYISLSHCTLGPASCGRHVKGANTPAATAHTSFHARGATTLARRAAAVAACDSQWRQCSCESESERFLRVGSLRVCLALALIAADAEECPAKICLGTAIPGRAALRVELEQVSAGQLCRNETLCFKIQCKWSSAVW